jgi:hypothetical protein
MITTKNLKQILASNFSTGLSGRDFGPIAHELQDELWRRQAREDEQTIKQFLKSNEEYMLRLVLEETTIEPQNEYEAEMIASGYEDELPPPIPTEAKLSWLSSVAKVKADIKPAEKVEAEMIEPKKPTNAWAGLPAETIVGDFRISFTDQPSRRDIHARSSEASDRPIARSPGLPYAPSYRFISARFNSTCEGCESAISRNEIILWYKTRKTVYCRECPEFQTANLERMRNGLTDVRTWNGY